MPTPLRVLIVEDTPDEADLMVLHLREAGMHVDWRRVETEADFQAELDQGPQLILCDWRLPKFSGQRALEIMGERGLDIPFVIVSGSIGEEAAIDAIRRGAYDYVLKDRPARLAPAVQHALDDRRLREERRQAEASLRESEERYRGLFNDMPVGIYQTGPEGRILDVNPALAALLGYETPDEMIGLDVAGFYADPADRANWRRAIQVQGELHETEIRLRHRDGSVIWVRDSGRAIYDSSGRLQHFQGTLADISERKAAEEEVRLSEERYRDLVENIHELICTHDLAGRILSFNRSAVELTGYPPDELLGRDLRQLLPAAHRPLFDGYLAELRQTGAAAGLMTIVTQGGQERIWEYHNTLRTEGVSQPIVRGYARDITEVRRAEAALRASEERYRTLLEMAPIGIAVHRAGKIVYANPAGVRILGGVNPDQVVGRSIQEIVHPDRLQAAFDRIRRMMAGEQGLYPTEDVYLRLDGTPVEVEVRAAPAVHEGEGAVQVIVQDITERRRAEQALRESEDRFRRLAEHAPDLIYRYRLTPEPGFEYVSPAATEITGYTPEEHYADPELGLKLVHPDDRPLLEAARAVQGDPSRPLRLRWVRKDGRVVWTEQRNVPIVGESGRVVALEGIARDVTSTVQAEIGLRRRAAEMEGLYQTSVQTLAAGDLRGLLTAIVQRATELTGGDRGAIYLPTEDGSRLRLHINLNLGRDYTGVELALGEGVSGRAALDRRAIMVEDYNAWAGKSPIFLDSGVGRVLAVPMLAGDRLVGVLNVADLNTGSYGEDEIRLVSLFADQAAMAIEGARLMDETTRRAGYLEALHQTTLEITSQTDLGALLAAIVDRAVGLLGLPVGGLYLLDEATHTLQLVVSCYPDRDYVGSRIAIGEGVAGQAVRLREPYAVENYSTWEGKAPAYDDVRLGRVLAVPLRVADRITGAVYVSDFKPGRFAPAEIRLVSQFADQAAVAIETARLLQETHRRAAYLEALTTTAAGLRAAAVPEDMYSGVLEEVVRQLRAEGATLSLLDADRSENQAVLAVGAWEPTTGMRLPLGVGVLGAVTESGMPLAVDDIRGDPRLARPDLLQDLPAIACVPLTVEDQPIGCVMVGRQVPFTSEEVRLLTGLAEIAGNAIHRARVMATLEERVRVRTRELEAANERLMELDRMKTEFVSNVTHELRTPITNILLYLDLARRTDLAPKRSHYFDVLKSESLRLGRLIEEVLTLSRLGRGAAPMDREPHSVEALLAEVRVAHQARADAKGLDLGHEPEIGLPLVPIQRTQIHQVLTNLVANAVAYTPPGGQVRLSTVRTRVEGREYVGAMVRNSGTWIAPEEMQHLFERFFRGSVGRQSGEAGTGLGLAISKEIIELHHGWIEVESDPDTGTAFTIWLPLEETPPGVGRGSPSA